MVRLLRLALILLLASCNSQKSSDVVINTSGIFTPVTVTYDHKEIGETYDFGEYVIGSGPALYTITVRNNSLFPLTELKMTMETFEAFGFGFEKTDDGKNRFPGKTGTCKAILLPTQSCTIVLSFETNISKFYEQPVTFSYLNYIEGANRVINLQVLAGNPASLIFDDNITNYYFGELVGMAEIPVLERDIDQEYSQVLRVTNAGDLKARNIVNNNIILTQTCNSAETKTCPAGQNTAYRIVHNCPVELSHGESCQVELFFKPLNQANTAEMKHVRYDSTVQIKYKTSLLGAEGVLNAYTTTNSVNIEARFETSIESQVFENKIVVGNRDLRAFRVNNRGFRNGFMRKLVVKDLLGVHVASCVANPLTKPWLECYDSMVTNIKTLAEFPFKLKDKNDCLGAPFDDGKIIPVDQGCAFDIQFQPSLTYQTGKYFDYEIFAEYDSLWKGNSTIAENQLHTLIAESLSAAKIVPWSIIHNGLNISDKTSLSDTIVTYDGGRVGLMSPLNFRRRNLLVTFKNEGGVAATVVVAKDGRGNIIPQKEINPVGVDIGLTNPKYFTKALINTNNCTEIEPNQTCTIQLSFAPVTFYDWTINANNMFDVLFPAPGPYLDSYKQFIMTYKDGSTYTDTNTYTTVVDSGPNQSESRLKMDLVEKGQLDDYTTQSMGLGVQTNGTSYRREVRFSNIGTKDIPYLPYIGSRDLKKLIKGTIIVPTNPASLDPGTLDCYGIFDFYHTSGDSLAVINARSHLWDPFPVGKDCLLTFEYYTPKRHLTSDDVKSAVGALKENSRMSDSSATGWEYERVAELGFDFALDAYDGDTTDPAAVGPLASAFGKHIEGKKNSIGATYIQAAKLTLYTPRPMIGSSLFRPGWSTQNVDDEEGVNFLIGTVIPDSWYFSDYTEQSTGFVGYDADFFKGNLTKNFFPHTMTLPTLTDYQLVYYMGSVPTGTVINGSNTLVNAGRQTANIISATINTIQRPNPISTVQHFNTTLTSATFPLPLGMISAAAGPSVSGGHAVSYSFSATDPGVYAAEIVINYKDGSYDSVGPYHLPLPGVDPRVPVIRQKKFLVVAEVSNNTPALKLDIQDYDIATDDVTPAIETPGAITPANMSYFENTTPVHTFTSIKIPVPARKDSYLKRRFIFYNSSATAPINEIKLFFRSNGSSLVKDGLQSPTSYYVCMTGSQTNATLAAVDSSAVAQPMCTGTCGTTAFNLAPGGSCYIEIRYQPTGSTTTKSVTLTALHKTDTNRYIHRNLDLSFLSQDPAAVSISNRTAQIIRTGLGTLNSYNIDFGSPIQTANPMVFSYDAVPTGGWNKMLQMLNPTITRASFLKSYQLYYKQFIDPAVTDAALKQMEPAYPAAYTKNVGGILYTLIWQQNYPSSANPRIQVWSNRECLVGDDTGQWFQKGFTGLTCKMIPILFADINYINRALNVNLASDMDPNYVRLQYYTSNRVSTAAVTFHFTGNMKPNTSGAAAPNGINYYQNVSATSDEGGKVTFKFAEMNPATPALGPIVGYRIYFSPTTSPLNTVFPALTPATPYWDEPVNGTGLYQLTQKNLGVNKYMYYRIYPIRQFAAYTQSPNPFGLSSGKYLSDPSIPVLPVVIPNANFIYQHIGRYLIERGVNNANLLTHAQAKTTCSSRSKLTVTQGPSVVQFSYAMIQPPVWNVILGRPDGSNYNLNDYSLWLDNSLVNIHAKVAAYPEYNPTADLAFLEAPLVFYIKKTGCGINCPGNTAVGNAFGQPGYVSYVESTVNFAGSRCYIQLP